MKKVNIIFSDTFFVEATKLNIIQEYLDYTLKEFLGKNDKIINIELHEKNGLSRFWIYYQ